MFLAEELGVTPYPFVLGSQKLPKVALDITSPPRTLLLFRNIYEAKESPGTKGMESTPEWESN